MALARATGHNRPLLLHDARRAVPTRTNRLSFVKSNRLPVINIITECLFNGINIRDKGVRRNLNTIFQASGKVGHERDRIRLGPLSNPVGPDNLRVRIESNEGPHIAQATAVILAGQPGLLLTDVTPNLIDLDTGSAQFPHLLIHDLGATFAYFDKQPHDCVAVRSDYAFRRAD
jgi:hypothetical protein